MFTLVTFIFTFCVTLTITSFKEIPLWVITDYTIDKHQRVNTTNEDMEAYSAVNKLTCNAEEVSLFQIVKVNPPSLFYSQNRVLSPNGACNN